MITDTLKKVCNMKNVDPMDDKKCGFQIIPRKIFHAIGYYDKRHDQPAERNAIFNMTKDSYGIHLWNYITRGIKFNLRNDGAMATFTKNSCPRTHSQYEFI